MKKLKNMLKSNFGLADVDVIPQQGGWSALAYKVFNEQHTYFLKAYEKSRTSTPKLTALINEYVPILVWLMNNSNLKGKIPVPVLTLVGDYTCEDDVGIYLLNEYICGETIGNKALTADQVYQLSEIIAELHTYEESIPIETDAMKEDFSLPFLQQLRNILNMERKAISNDVSALLFTFKENMMDLANTIEKLGVSLRQSN